MGLETGTMRARVVKALKPLHAVSVENGVGVGTPDVNCTWGWIELKAVPTDKIPVRDTTPIRLPHFTPQQKIWLTKRWRAGGNCGVLLQVGTEWFWFTAPRAVECLDNLSLPDLRGAACTYWPKTPSDSQLQQCFDSQN